MGLDPSLAQAWLADQDQAGDPDDGADCDEQPGGTLAVWPENWPALRVWQLLQTQWHLTPSGHMQGLRYDAADVVIVRTLRGASITEQDQVFAHLVEMEHAAVEALDE